MVVQPDLGKWRQLKAEMTEAEVAALLGQPYRKDPRPPDDITPDVINLYGWYYGEITFKSFSTQGAFQYTVGFHEGQVREINDPWNGQFSSTRMTSTSPSRGWAPTPVAGGSGA